MSRYTGKLSDLYQSYARVIGQWPADKLRPTHCYKGVLKAQMKTKFDRLNSLRGEELSREAGLVERELEALSNLVSNKYRSQYKVSEALADPVSNKGYYTKLLESIDSAVKSNKRTSLRVD
ncbi:hypothetical protein GGI03_000205 [Coemansia sp. RSA 2337]|nr:hypothetical protein LPJ71_009552 [Coemansia sp. S17]KAJ2020188.1 hypothetical protein GGI14_001047 [Coemansia sp. S680]KAJ2066584.1 hypothetical protein GGH13_005658 [Coemansia sp. S155-1]KAJ2098417.1 hypothetical protein GGI16_004287 [Coemansia sp. S142-1]KAJ2110719.1 hypothetical protein IW146_005781 [Coemansia sp. RSA 922]KAJ2340216.1 hypothetical protein GGH92_006363 [Coemansia sp. RSA 2673]KAJ2469671.1 hypothetical protein GGI03_000205 [Coemansia sp. RSA 2337]